MQSADVARRRSIDARFKQQEVASSSSSSSSSAREVLVSSAQRAIVHAWPLTHAQVNTQQPTSHRSFERRPRTAVDRSSREYTAYGFSNYTPESENEKVLHSRWL